MKGRLLLAGLFIVALPAAAWALWPGAGERGRTGSVSRGDFRTMVDASGTLEAALFYEIGPPSARDFWNYQLTWMIPEGTAVKEGQVVARFDAQRLEDLLRDHRAELEKVSREKEKEQRQLDIQLRQLGLDLVDARGEIEKVAVESSVPEELVPALELAETRLKEDLARRRAAFLEEKIAFQKKLVQQKIDLLEVKRQRAEQKIDYYSRTRAQFDVKAPIDGVVIYVPKNNGDRWEVGESVWMLAKILKVADITTLRVEAQVLEADAATIRVGQPAEVTAEALPGLVIRSEVAEIGRIIRERSVQDSTKVFDIYLPLADIDPETMKPGMSVRVAVETRYLADALTVPLESVRVSESGPWVELVGDRGRRERRAVVLGPRNRRSVVVLEGVDTGDRVSLMPPETGA